MNRQEMNPLPFRTTQEQDEYERSKAQEGVTRRRFLGSGVILGAFGALILTGKGEEVLAKITREDKGPTNEQKEVYNHLVVEKLDIIKNLVLVGEPSLPSNLRNSPFTPRENEKPVDDVITKIGKTISVGDGFVVMGNDPQDQNNSKNTDPWIAILNPVRDKSREPRPEDVVFSHYGNFALSPEQSVLVAKAARRLTS